MTSMKKKLFLAVAIIVVAVLAALIFLTPSVSPEEPLPNPNGYDDFVKAATLIERNPPDWWPMQGEELHAALQRLVATNQSALALVRTGLAKKCRMVPWEMNATNGQHLNDLAGSKALAQAVAAASRLALIEGRTNEAAALATDCIRFGNESARGGVLIDGLVGIAIKSIGLSSLKSAAEGMDLESTRKTLSALDEVASRSEPAEDILKRERQWARSGRFGSAGILTQIIQPFLNRKALEKGRQKFTEIETDLQRTRIQLARHAFELDHGQPPATARDLVPQYLKAIPLDPATSQELPVK